MKYTYRSERHRRLHFLERIIEMTAEEELTWALLSSGHHFTRWDNRDLHFEILGNEISRLTDTPDRAARSLIIESGESRAIAGALNRLEHCITARDRDPSATALLTELSQQ